MTPTIGEVAVGLITGGLVFLVVVRFASSALRRLAWYLNHWADDYEER
jgi:hypothetical protein